MHTAKTAWTATNENYLNTMLSGSLPPAKTVKRITLNFISSWKLDRLLNIVCFPLYCEAIGTTKPKDLPRILIET